MMADFYLDFGDISSADIWQVDTECLDFVSAGDLCLDQLFLTSVRVTVNRQDISPSSPVPLLLMLRELIEGIEQAKKYAPSGRGCVLIPSVFEYELQFTEDRIHLFWFTHSFSKGQGNFEFKEEFVVDRRHSMEAFEKFAREVFDALKSGYDGLEKNRAFQMLEQRASEVLTHANP